MEMNVGKMSSADCWSCAKIADRMIGSVIRRFLFRTCCNLFILLRYTSVNFQYTTMQKRVSPDPRVFSFPIFNFAD